VFTLICSLEFAHILVLVHDAEIVVQFFVSLRTSQHRRSQAAISLGDIVISADVFEASFVVDNMNTICFSGTQLRYTYLGRQRGRFCNNVAECRALHKNATTIAMFTTLWRSENESNLAARSWDIS